jgi:heat shock 70kDa protein 4
LLICYDAQIGPFQPSKGEKAKLKVKVRLNIHGIVTVDSATVILEPWAFTQLIMECMGCLSDLVPCYFCMQMLEEENVEVPVSAANEVPKDATKMDTDAPSEPASGTDVNMQDPKSTEAAEGAPAAENGGQDAEEKSVPMDTDAKVRSALTNFVSGISF